MTNHAEPIPCGHAVWGITCKRLFTTEHERADHVRYIHQRCPECNTLLQRAYGGLVCWRCDLDPVDVDGHGWR